MGPPSSAVAFRLFKMFLRNPSQDGINETELRFVPVPFFSDSQKKYYWSWDILRQLFLPQSGRQRRDGSGRGLREQPRYNEVAFARLVGRDSVEPDFLSTDFSSEDSLTADYADITD